MKVFDPCCGNVQNFENTDKIWMTIMPSYVQDNIAEFTTDLEIDGIAMKSKPEGGWYHCASTNIASILRGAATQKLKRLIYRGDLDPETETSESDEDISSRSSNSDNEDNGESESETEVEEICRANEAIVPEILKLKHLEILEVHCCIDMSFCKNFTELKELFVNRVNDESLAEICMLKKLEVLDIQSTAYHLSEQGMQVMQKLTSLKKLKVCDVDISGNAFKELSNLSQLEALTLEQTSLSVESMKSISQIKSLKILNLGNCYLLDANTNINGDVSLDYISNLQRLEEFTLHSSSFYGSGLMNFGRMSSLEYLDLEKCWCLDNTGLTSIGDIKSLKILKLSYKNISGIRINSTNEVLQRFSLLPCLKEFSLTRESVSYSSGNLYTLDKGIDSLSQTSTLTKLALHMIQLTDLAFCRFTELSQLVQLDISMCVGITNDAIKHISEIPNLEELDLTYCHQVNHLGIQQN